MFTCSPHPQIYKTWYTPPQYGKFRGKNTDQTNPGISEQILKCVINVLVAVFKLKPCSIWFKLVIFTKQSTVPKSPFFPIIMPINIPIMYVPMMVYDCLINILLIFHRPAFWGSMIPLIIHSSEVEMCRSLLFTQLMLVKQ